MCSRRALESVWQSLFRQGTASAVPKRRQINKALAAEGLAFDFSRRLPARQVPVRAKHTSTRVWRQVAVFRKTVERLPQRGETKTAGQDDGVTARVIRPLCCYPPRAGTPTTPGVVRPS